MQVPQFGVSVPLAPPLYQSSVYRIPDLDALDRISDLHDSGFIYARDGHPNAQLLAEQIATLECGQWALVTGSGMAALTVACLACVATGERIVASNRLYGRTTALLREELARYGVQCDFIDCGDLTAVEHALLSPARLLVVETISNPMLRIADIPALADIAHRHGCRLLVDNTFATPALFRPLEHGADLVMESLTKMIGGHSDVTLGSLAGDEPELHRRLAQIASVWGFFAAPFDCWLAERSLSSLELRVHAASANAARLAEWLRHQQGVRQVIYPALVKHLDHALAARLLPNGTGHMLCFEIEGREAVNRFLRQARGIPFCPSLGHATTTCSHPASTSHRFESAEEKQRQGISEGLIRLSVGIEPFENITREMHKGLEPPAS